MSDRPLEDRHPLAVAGSLWEAGGADAEEQARGAGAADEHPYGDRRHNATVDIAAVVDLWRSWMELGGSLGQAPSPASRRPRAPPPIRPGV
jgi:hypothetical protein